MSEPWLLSDVKRLEAIIRVVVQANETLDGAIGLVAVDLGPEYADRLREVLRDG